MPPDSDPSSSLTCPACGQPVTAEDEFCTQCWEPLSEVRTGSTLQAQPHSTRSEQPVSSPSVTPQIDAKHEQELTAASGDNSPIGNPHDDSTTDPDLPFDDDSIIEATLSQVETTSIVTSSATINADSVVEAEVLSTPPTPVARSPFAPQYEALDSSAPKKPTEQLPIENMAAKGGAVGAVVLGVMAIPGAVVTSASAITALLGIGLGLWGLLSKHRRSSIIGISLCVVALLLCLFRDALGFSRWF